MDKVGISQRAIEGEGNSRNQKVKPERAEGGGEVRKNRKRGLGSEGR